MKTKKVIYLIAACLFSSLLVLQTACSKDKEDDSTPTPTTPTTVVYGGQTYNIQQIGTQYWLKENMNVGTMINGNAIQSNNGQIEKYCYNNDPANCVTYGALYQWDEMMQYSNLKGTQGICPTGWHIPTDAEWTVYIDYLGGENVAGGKMKEAGTYHWAPPNTGATNESGFTALPGGACYSDDGFGELGTRANFWSSTKGEYSDAWLRSLSYDNTTVNRSLLSGVLGFSVRCMKDESATTIPTVTTTAITNITQTTATGGGNVTSQGSSAVIARGICWNTSQNPVVSDICTSDGTGSGSFTSAMYELNPNTTYYVRAYASNNEGISYGNEVSFTTLGGGSGSTFTDPRDGNVYQTVTIGNQVWMAENLKYLASVVGPGTGSETTPYHYVYGYNGTSVSGAKATSNYSTYGVLYNWTAAVNACPAGWHLPSDAEWTQLTDYLGGESVAGGKLKETGTAHWNSPNTGATNETGFTALPGGDRYSDGTFIHIGSNGYWLSATEDNTNYAWGRSMSYNGSNVHRHSLNKVGGFSVRCLKDSGGGAITVTLDNVNPNIQAYQTWTESDVVLSFQDHPEAGGNPAYFGIETDRIWLYPALLHADLSGLQGTVMSVEVDVLDWCGVGCTTAKLFDSGVEITQTGNIVAYGTETLYLTNTGGYTPDVLTVGSFEGQVLEIRLVIQSK